MFPQIFGKYVLERLIAVGGMARVFLATLRGAGGFEKKLVVKQIRAELATDEAFVRRFVDEAKTTVELSHPNIVPVYELGVEQGIYYLAMELCDGVTLDELVQKTGNLSPAEGAYVGVEICRALDYAHRRARIIHRDVTPRNVIVDEEGGIRLIDFGIAAPAFSGAKEVFGSPGHMPPEQLKGGQLGPPTDVFAAAALLYEAWSSVAPFRRSTPEASEAALSEPVPFLSTFDAALAPLDHLVASAMSPDAAARPQSAEDFSRPLRRFLDDADLGDLARKLGARVAKLKKDPTDPSAGSTDEASERPSSPDVTRTFATRSFDADASHDAPSASVANSPPSAQSGNTVDVATRRMNEERASWSTGRAAQGARSRRGALWAAGALLVVAASASGAFWRREENRRDGDSPAPTQGAGRADVVARDAEPGAPFNAAPESPDTRVEPMDAGATAKPAAPASSSAANASGTASTGETRGAPAHLRILANPEATVEIDGRTRGPAPIADIALAPGTHFVRLDCGPLGEAVSQNVHVAPGESVVISGDFTGAHGRILVRRASGAPGTVSP